MSNQANYIENNMSLGRTCSICGAHITDDNPDGIGYGCRAIYEGAKAKTYFKFHWQAHRAIKVNTIMALFESTFAKTKFRSDFRKSFYPSVVTFWKEKGYVSNRQLEICGEWIERKLDYDEMTKTYRDIKDSQSDKVNEFEPKTDEEIKFFQIAIRQGHADAQAEKKAAKNYGKGERE